MDNQIMISMPEVSNTAASIRNHNTKLDETLNYVSRIMNELNNAWESDGQQTLISRFAHFSEKFINEYEVIESYARFLDDTVSSYDSLESTIVANASNFK